VLPPRHHEAALETMLYIYVYHVTQEQCKLRIWICVSSSLFEYTSKSLIQTVPVGVHNIVRIILSSPTLLNKAQPSF
jgi:hypothetical protein